MGDVTGVELKSMATLLGETETRSDTVEESHHNPKHVGLHHFDHGPQGSKISLLPLICLIFYEVSGGPFGVEDAVKNGGPLLALLGFLIFPMVWSIPEAVVTAELSTTYPEDGGYVIWVAEAFGEYWGFQEGWWKWLSGVIDNSLYPILFLDYLKTAMPVFGGGAPRWIAILVITVVLTYLNYRGLSLVGVTAIALAGFSLLPFIVLSVMAIPKIKPKRWLKVRKGVHWRGYINSLFWNLNYWDSASTLAGEVQKPRETFPKALSWAVVLVVLSYIVPLLGVTGALPFSPEEWQDGFFGAAAGTIVGPWLQWWIVLAAALSNIGLFEAEMSSDAYSLLGMGEVGMIPEVFARRSQYGTPTLAIVCSASGVVALSWMTFEQMLEFLNFLYCIAMLLEFGAFLALRVRHPELDRPYKVPLSTFGCFLMLLPPSALLVVVMALASLQTVVVSSVAALFGFVLYPFLMWLKRRGYVAFVERAFEHGATVGDGSEPAPRSPHSGPGRGVEAEDRGKEGAQVADQGPAVIPLLQDGRALAYGLNVLP